MFISLELKKLAFVFSLIHSLCAQKVYDVIVIGGGVSGLTASAQLIQDGHTNILLLEASNRLGGRVNTVQTTG